MPASSESRRSAWVLVSFSITPLLRVSDIERLMVSEHPSRSTSLHRNAHSSPRRAPVAAASRKNTGSVGLISPERSTRVATSAGRGIVRRALVLAGAGPAEAAGLDASQPHRTPCSSAVRITAWIRFTEFGERGRPPGPPVLRSSLYQASSSADLSRRNVVAPHRGTIRRSMMDRYTSAVVGDHSSSPRANHRSINSPTVPAFPEIDPSSTWVTRRASSRSAWRLVPRTVWVTYCLRWVSGSRPANTRSSQLVVPRCRIEPAIGRVWRSGWATAPSDGQLSLPLEHTASL